MSSSTDTAVLAAPLPPAGDPQAAEREARERAAREKYRRDKKNNKHFWRALSYLGPYRWMVVTSIVCAFFVGLTMTSGLGTMLPIIRVLINGDTIQGWMYRTTAEKRLGLKLVDDPDKVQILRVDPQGPARRAGLGDGDVIDAVAGGATAAAPANAARRTTELLRQVARDPSGTVDLVSRGAAHNVALKPARAYLAWGMAIAEHLPSHPVWSIAAVFGIMAGLAIVGNVIRYFQEHLSDKAAILAVDDIRRHLYDHVLHLGMTEIGAQGPSDVTSRLVQDSANLQDGFKTVLGQSIQEPIKAAMAFGLAMLLSWKLTLFIIAFAPVMMLIIKKFGKKMRRASRKALQESASMLGQLEATLGGIRVVKAAGAERYERRRYQKIMNGLVAEQLRMSRIDAMSTPTLETLTLLVAGIVVLYAAYLVLIARTLEPEIFIMVMVALVTIGESLRRCSKVNNALQRSNAAAARIFEILDLPIERVRAGEAHPELVESRILKDHRAAAGRSPVPDPRFDAPVPVKRRTNLPPFAREIRFEDLSFAYPNSTALALDGVSLAVPKGRSVAIVGRNGSGKSTLLALLERFYDPTGGRITIDGIDVRDVTLRSLRRQISIVTQDSIVFPGTIAENIAYGHPMAAMLTLEDYRQTPAVQRLRAQIEAAAKRAFAHDFILEKPQGYDTVLGELGGQLSGGQRQRICIARAILKESPILILDEATSQVDSESEGLIQKAIDKLMHERTTFVIAHRFATIRSADVIVVLERGRIVGQGKHEDLLKTCPTYAQLAERQLFAA